MELVLRIAIKKKLKKLSNVHFRSRNGDIFIVAMPRGGSTWLAELIATQPGFKYVSEFFNLRNPLIRETLGFSDWPELYMKKNSASIMAYIEGLSSGNVSIMNHSPLSRHHRFFTNRIVLKMIHGGEDKLELLLKAGHCIIHFLRHPIAVTLSRKELPRLHAFIQSDLAKHFSEEQLKFAEDRIMHGSHNEKGIVSWCFQNALPLRIQHHRMLRLTYEQLVMEPEIVLSHLNKQLQLTKLDKIYRHLNKPSSVIYKSNHTTKEAIRNDSKSFLINKWKSQISPEEEKHLMSILKIFDVECYHNPSPISDSLWISG